MKLLIVEDDPDQLEIRTMLFEAAGFECIGALDPQTAERLAHQHAPACIVMDIGLPTERDGTSLIGALRQMPSSPRIVVLTGRHAFQHDSVHAVIEKGTPAAILIQTVRHACHTSESAHGTLPK